MLGEVLKGKEEILQVVVVGGAGGRINNLLQVVEGAGGRIDLLQVVVVVVGGAGGRIKKVDDDEDGVVGRRSRLADRLRRRSLLVTARETSWLNISRTSSRLVEN